MKKNNDIEKLIKTKKLLEKMYNLNLKINYELSFYLDQPQDKKYPVEFIYGILVGISEEFRQICQLIHQTTEDFKGKK